MTTWSNTSEVTTSFDYSSKNATAFFNDDTAVDHELLIGDTFYLSIGDGYRLLIDPSDVSNWTNRPKN